jgi:hypothetical protein
MISSRRFDEIRREEQLDVSAAEMLREVYVWRSAGSDEEMPPLKEAETSPHHYSL